MAVQWDEVNHLTGGLLLIRGNLIQYFLTSSFYPPVFNLATAVYFTVAGPTIFAARLVAVTFSALSIIAVYELAKRMYGSKTGLISAIIFAFMPGVVWLSRIALIETMLIFVFLVSMLYFFRWLETSQGKDLTISAVAFVIGCAVKYQILVIVPIVMLGSMLIFGRKNYLKAQIFSVLKFPRVMATVVVSVIAAIAVFELYIHGLLSIMWFAIQTGTSQASLYSVKYPAPIFYLIEMAFGPDGVHPISLLVYALAFGGIVLFALRRKSSDKFLLICFATIYVVFTIIPNKDWRYVILLFPVLAISASNLLVLSLEKMVRAWKSPKSSKARKRAAKLSAACLIVFSVSGIVLSFSDAQNWLSTTPPKLPIEQATAYAAQSLCSNQSIVVACPVNLLSNYLVWFYLNAKAPSQSTVWQYPTEAVDAYTLSFNTTDFIRMCQQNNAKYVFLYEYGGYNYFDSNLTSNNISATLTTSSSFVFMDTFGTAPNRIYVFAFK
jgi:4-amino-4-deoxy-L-arabinose transferase-like glycosyltransferase